MGNLEVKLNDTVRSIKVDCQTFHGDIFVRNHCKIILAKHEYVCIVLEGAKSILKLCIFLGKSSHFCSLKKFFLKAEISRGHAKYWKFGTLVPTYFPNEIITCKIHQLVFDVPEFCSAFKTIGRYAEEEGESLHNSVN